MIISCNISILLDSYLIFDLLFITRFRLLNLNHSATDYGTLASFAAQLL